MAVVPSQDQDYPKSLLFNAVVGLLTFSIAQIVFDKMPPEQAETIKKDILKSWEGMAQEQWKKELTHYMAAVDEMKDRVSNIEALPQPEDLEREWVQMFRGVRETIEKALWPLRK